MSYIVLRSDKSSEMCTIYTAAHLESRKEWSYADWLVSRITPADQNDVCGRDGCSFRRLLKFPEKVRSNGSESC